MRQSAFVGFSFLIIVSLVGLAGFASPAAAFGTICSDNCSLLGAADRGDGKAFDFDLGISASGEDRMIHVSTRGNVYLVGPISTAKRTKLKARTILLDSDLGELSNIKLKTRNLISDFIPAEDPMDVADRNAKTRIKQSRKKVRIKSNGDIYIDVSEIDLRKLKIKARGSIVLSDDALDGSMPVPEPSVAFMMALGLAGLSLRRLGAARDR